MTSLRWICVVTLALILCLTAQPIPLDKDDIEWIINKTIPSFSKAVENAACQDAGPMYYAPVGVNENCLGSALGCYIGEINMLIENCDKDIRGSSNYLLTELNITKNSLPHCEAFQCEAFAEKPFAEFLEDMKTLLQQIASTSH